MCEPIYFTEIKYAGVRVGINRKFLLLLDLVQRKLSYQVIEQRRGDSTTTEHIVVSYNKGLSAGWMNQLLPLCNARDFEPYRFDALQKPEKWEKAEDIIGYRDGVSITFCGITDSYIPKLELGMTVLYDKPHEPPQERLYQYLVRNFLMREKELRQYIFR